MNSLFKSGSETTGILAGAGQSRSRMAFEAHERASIFAVVTVDFLVQQKTIMGFLSECFAMISGNLTYA
jgi:ATP-dependent Zn protease